MRKWGKWNGSANSCCNVYQNIRLATHTSCEFMHQSIAVAEFFPFNISPK